MRNIFLWSLLLNAPLLSGCSWTQKFFNTFSNSYSGGGYSTDDKRVDYERNVQSWENSGS